MFKSYASKGFQVTFENEFTVSVMYGAGNYCKHHHNHDVEPLKENNTPRTTRLWHSHASEDAEVAVIGPDGNFVKDWPHCHVCDHVAGWLSPAQVLEVMNWAAAQKTEL